MRLFIEYIFKGSESTDKSLRYSHNPNPINNYLF